MTLKYAQIHNISKRLEGRLTIVSESDYTVTGITGVSIGTDLLNIVGLETEDMMDMYLSMVYVLPLVAVHPYLNGIAEKLIVADLYETYFLSNSDGAEGNDSFSSVMRQTALNNFQSLFNGLGIFVSGATTHAINVQNDEQQQQMQNKAIILPGETIKKFIGYDYDGDGLSDSDLFKLNANVDHTFINVGTESEYEQDVVNGIRVRDYKYNKWKWNDPNYASINFW